MLNINIRNVIAPMVRQLLIRNVERKNPIVKNGIITDFALYLNFDLRVHYYTSYKSYSQWRGLHLLYRNTPGYSYVDVFSATTDTPFDDISNVKNWKHEISHDSCWNDINIFSNTYFDMCKKINNEMKYDGLDEVAPKNMQENHSLRDFDEFYKWIQVQVSKDPSDSNNYRKLVKVL